MVGAKVADLEDDVFEGPNRGLWCQLWRGIDYFGQRF